MNDAGSLESVVQRVRLTRHPRLPEEIVATVLRIQQECLNDRSEARRRIQQAVDDLLADEA